MLTTDYQKRACPHEVNEFSDWHERCIEHLMRQSGFQVIREPLIQGKTPDLLVIPEQNQPFIIECLARLQDPSHAMELTHNGWHFCDGNIRELHQNIYSRLEQKATKYRDITEHTPYVIALYDATCTNSLDNAIDMMLAPYAPTRTLSAEGKIIGKHYNTLWSTPEIPVALFELYPHLSGFIYSRWPKTHYYLPNPYATKPLNPDLFQFAQIPQLPHAYGQKQWQPRPAIIEDNYTSPPETWIPQMQKLSEIIEFQSK